VTSPSPAVATAAAVLSTVLGGIAVVITRDLASTMAPAAIAGWRYGIALAAIVPIAVVLGRWRVSNASLWPIIALGVAFYGIYPYLFAAGLAKTTAARGALLLATMPLMTALIGSLTGVERITRHRLIGVVIAVFGVAVALADKVETERTSLEGDLLMLAAAIVGAGCQVALKRPLEAHGTMPVTLWTMVGGVAVLEAFGAFSAGFPSLDASGWTALLFLALVSGALGLFLWAWAIRHTSPTRAAVCVTVNPIVALLLASPILGEPITPLIVAGTVLVGVGIVIAARA